MGVLCAWRRSSRKTHSWRSGHLHIFKVSHFGRLVALAMGVPDHWLKKGRGKGKPGLKGQAKATRRVSEFLTNDRGKQERERPV